MSYDAKALECIATELINGNIKREDLEEKICKAKCKGADYIVTPPSSNTKTSVYKIEDQGDRLVRIKNIKGEEKIVAVLEYYFDSPGVLYLPWGESYEKGMGHMGSLFSEVKSKEGVKTIMIEIDDINEKMQEIAYHWGFKQGGSVQNSNNTNSSYYFYDLK